MSNSLNHETHSLPVAHDTVQDVDEDRGELYLSDLQSMNIFYLLLLILMYFHVEWALSSVFVTERDIWILYINKENAPKFSTGIFIFQRDL